jgi:nickel transport protein
MGKRRIGEVGNRRRVIRSIGVLVWGLTLFLAAAPANAHRVTVFAWVDGHTVHVQSKFAGGKRVKGGKITVLDLKGNILHKGTTNEQGEFSFKIPKPTALRIVLNAGMGHRAEWTVPLEEIQGAGSTAGEGKTPLRAQVKTPDPRKRPAVLSGSVDPEEIQRAVERAMDKKLQQVMRLLSEERDRGVSLSDVMGGIGYILGLMGVAAWAHNRRRASKVEEERVRPV